MKRNLYTNSIESIKAPESLINKSIAKLSDVQFESEVIIMKPKYGKSLKVASIIAATLVILIAVGVFTFIGKDEVKHPFILTVGAEKITTDTYIKFGNTAKLNDSIDSIIHGYVDKNGNFVRTDNYADLMSVRKDFNVEINCQGENIESITYKAINGCLSYKWGCSGLLGVTQLSMEEIKKYHASGAYDNYQWASSCTFDYNAQPKAKNDVGPVPLLISFSFDFKEGEYILPIDEEYRMDSNTPFQKEFNQHADEFGLEVTANFKDGTSTTKTLKFKCESDGNDLYLNAIEAIS